MAEKLKPQAPIIDNKKSDDKEKRPQLVEGITDVIKELKALNTAGKKNVLGDIETGKKAELCPYEIALSLCKDAKVIISDYFYLFN